jgi:hypothetical protein
MDKFHSCAQRVIALDKAERIVELVEKLEQLSHVEELMSLARG